MEVEASAAASASGTVVRSLVSLMLMMTSQRQRRHHEHAQHDGAGIEEDAEGQAAAFHDVSGTPLAVAAGRHSWQSAAN